MQSRAIATRDALRLRPLLRVAVLALCAACLVLPLLVNGAWVALVLASPREAIYHEAVVYDHAARILRGESLYRSIDSPPYSIAAYTPLYYVVAAGLRAVFGPGFGPGRGLSVVAGLTAALVVGWLTARAAGDRRAGIFAAALFLAVGAGGIVVQPWLVSYKEDTLGVALALLTIAALSWRRTPGAVVLAAALAALAFLTKQTFVAAGLAGAIWLWSQDRRQALWFVGVGTLLAGGVVAVETLTQAFLANVVWSNVNPFRGFAMLANLTILMVLFTGPLVLASAFVAGTRRWRAEPRTQLLVLYWACAALPLVGLGKVGSNYNYWTELAAATAALATLGLWTWLRGASPRALWPAVGIFAVHLGWLSLLGIPRLAAETTSWDQTMHPDPRAVAAWNALVARVRAEPRLVLATPLDVIVLADRPIVFEPYIYNILALEGRWDPAPVVDAICDGDVGLLVLGDDLNWPGPSYHGYAHWPTAALTALRRTMQFTGIQAGRYVYVPSAWRPPGGCTAGPPPISGD